MTSRVLCALALVIASAALISGSAEAHPSQWYWGVSFTQSKLLDDDVCFGDGSCRDVVRANCIGREQHPATGRKDWIWNKPKTVRLYRHFTCLYQFSNGAIWKSLLHVMGENGLTMTNSTLQQRAGRAVPPRPTPTPSSRVYVGVGGGHWIRDVIDRGKLIKLEDGSLWKIGLLNYVDAILWLPFDDITVLDGGVYGYRLLNEDDGELVDATFLGYG